jgi:hypothetical protein
MVTKWLVTRLVPLGLVLFLLGPLAVRLALLLGESPLLLVGVVGVLWLLRQSTRKQRHPHRPPRGEAKRSDTTVFASGGCGKTVPPKTVRAVV